jgi:uncharacterized protein YbjT (DUF2867 family)
MILVTAASGQVGGATLSAIAATGRDVRALVRDPSRLSVPNCVQVAKGDFDDEASLKKALDGITVMLLAGRDSPDSVVQHERVLSAAYKAGVRHIVKLSAIGASPSSPVALMREHHLVDEEVRRQFPGSTFLKPHLFLQNLLRAGEAVQQSGKLSAPMGTDAYPLVDTRDVGEAAASVLLNPDEHNGMTYSLTGPQAVTYTEVASAISAVAGKPVTYEALAPAAFEQRLLGSGIPDWRAFDLANIASAYRHEDNIVSEDLSNLLQRPPRSLQDFMADHRSAYRA